MRRVALRPPADVFICAGEASGDAYGAALATLLREQLGAGTVIAGMGGPQMAAAGVEIDQSNDGMAVMGFTAVLARLPRFLRLLGQVADLARARTPRVVVTIDYPGFNLRLLRRLAALRPRCSLVHVVAPQVWAWKPRRAKRVAQLVDRLLCFFPFEPPLFTRHGGQADFVGHPLVDLVEQNPDLRRLDEQLKLHPADQLLLVAPGSREREVAELLPVMLVAAEQAAQRLRVRGERVQIVVSQAPGNPLAWYRQHTALPLVEGDYRLLCARAHFGLIASGTATLEAALAGLPHVICYRTDPIQARIARHVLLTRHVGLPNIVHGARVCPELLQDECTAPRLCERIVHLWSGDHRAAMVHVLSRTRQKLGGPGAMQRMAQAIAAEAAKHPRDDAIRSATFGAAPK